mgnify:FL=1
MDGSYINDRISLVVSMPLLLIVGKRICSSLVWKPVMLKVDS